MTNHNDLTEQIRRWDDGQLPIRMETLIEAARLVANPNIEAAVIIINGLRHVTTEDGWDESVPVFTEEAISAALTLPGDDE